MTIGNLTRQHHSVSVYFARFMLCFQYHGPDRAGDDWQPGPGGAGVWAAIELLDELLDVIELLQLEDEELGEAEIISKSSLK